MKLSVKRGILLTFIVVAADLVLSLILSWKANNSIEDVNNVSFIEIIGNYNFFTCQLDFVILSLLRAALLSGACFGVLNNRKDGPERIKSGSMLSVCFFLTTFVYSLLKLLALTEVKTDLNLPWFWSIFGFNMFISFINALIWNCVLSNIISSSAESSAADKRESVLVVPVDSTDISDVAPLVINEHIAENGGVSNVVIPEHVINEDKLSADKKSTGDKPENIKLAQSTSLILRLLRYCRREWIWYLIGFIFLGLYSGSKCTHPVYAKFVKLIMYTSASN